MNRRIVQETPATDKFVFLQGAFEAGEWRIPYFMSALTYEQSDRYLRLSEEFANSDEIAWKIDELYQRGIDWHRVQREIVKYLESTDAHFFNALTIALLPMVDDQPSLHGSFEEDGPWQAPELRHDGLVNLEIGPISLGYFEPFDPASSELLSGVMRWNPQQVHAVAIDGQHRLAAIKQLVQDQAHLTQAKTRVPVILLILDSRLGFKRPSSGSLVTILRNLFIDLNKHAQKVQRARQILLDDRDPMSVFVRNLLTDSLCDDVNSLHAPVPKLPLSIVDWHSEQAKFETGPYLTTVMGLDGIVAKIFQEQRTPELTDYEGYAAQLNKFRQQLPGLDIEPIRAELEQQRLAGMPFTYEPKWISEMVAQFGLRWNTAVVALLTEFQPYKALLARRVEDGSLDLKWQAWYRKKEAAGSELSGREFEDFSRYKRHLLGLDIQLADYEQALADAEQMKRNLAFTVVFQRAYMDAFLEFCKVGPEQLRGLKQWAAGTAEAAEDRPIEDIPLPPEEDVFPDGAAEEQDPDEIVGGVESTASEIARDAQLFVSLLNEVLDVFPRFIELQAPVEDADGRRIGLWKGSLQAAGRIDYTKGASTRAKDIIFLAAIMAWIKRNNSAGKTAEDFEAECLENRQRLGFRHAAMAIGRLSSAKPKGVALRSLEESDAADLSESERKRVALERVSGLWVCVNR